MTVINFSHPLTASQLQAVEQLTHEKVGRIIDVKTQFDNSRPFVEQMPSLMDGIGLLPAEWQTERLLVNLPSLNVITALLLAEVHGRCGYFPAVLRMRPIEGATPLQFEVAEIISLQAVREAARQTR